MKALAFFEVKNGKFKKSSLNLLLNLKERLKNLNTKPSLFFFCTENDLPFLLKEIETFDVEKIYAFKNDIFKNYNAEIFLKAFDPVFKENLPQFLISVESSLTLDFFPRLAARYKSPFVNHCIEWEFLNPENKNQPIKNSLLLRLPLYSGKCFVEAKIKENTPLYTFLVTPSSLKNSNQEMNPPQQKMKRKGDSARSHYEHHRFGFDYWNRPSTVERYIKRWRRPRAGEASARLADQ